MFGDFGTEPDAIAAMGTGDIKTQIFLLENDMQVSHRSPCLGSQLRPIFHPAAEFRSASLLQPGLGSDISIDA